MRYATMAVIGTLTLCAGHTARSDDRSCWMDDMPGKLPSPEVTCVPLTERFLLSLEGASEAQVMKAMGAPGLKGSDGINYHYMSNYIGTHGRSGDVNITFENGRAVIVAALLDRQGDDPYPIEFIWNAREVGCSDFPGNHPRCRD